MLRPLPPENRISRAPLLAHAILFHGLHERVPTTIVLRDEAENISAGRLSPVIEVGDLKRAFDAAADIATLPGVFDKSLIGVGQLPL